ncbi:MULTISPECIES: nitrite/sulfite reductase [Acidobacteriaceae]|uniref:nitrite/sulfite reductase n=1 Tax=Acidobacteriaceae TaxID=204434 RepID=UPI00131C64DB|nr:MULTISPECIES: nitrite/sulfite reductase [Acidobacteriaceae]MDW5264407.1 nitrite/sulfite reductase [Edaphobacter sp.]
MTTPSAPVIKETKAQKTERLKLAKNPWEAFDEIRQFARDGRDSVPEEWALYFRWWGVYSQGDGLGLAGGKNGEGKATEFFMLRIGLPNGLLTSHQLRVIAGITKKFARNLADITTRQNIQLHWLTIADLVEVVDTLTEIGLSPKGACGDVVRNVTGCPLAGINHDELIDAAPLAVEVARTLTANNAFVNLPRKFKISVSGCPLWCNYPEINDVALTAIKHLVDGKEEVGYTLRVGGGLSTEPHIAARIPAFIRQDQALATVIAAAEIFRDADVLRENRAKARSKYLFMKFGWTPESYLEALEAKLGYKLIPSPAEDENIADDIYRDHIGITQQRQPGLSSVGASVLRGRVTGDQLQKLADLADKYGNGQLRATIMQNIIIVNVPNEMTAALVIELNTLGFLVDVSTFWRGAIACTGTEFCKLAITETKGFAKWLVSEMEDRLPGFDQQIKLHVTGCTNSCGQHWIADIGLEGKKIKKDGKLVDAFQFCVGGAVGKYARTSRPLGYRAAAEDVPDAIERLLQAYLADRQADEDLRAYFARHDDNTLRALLNGEAIDAVERDAPPVGAGRLAPGE